MSSLKLSFEHDGQVARVALAAPKANIVDQAMMAAWLRPSRTCGIDRSSR